MNPTTPDGRYFVVKEQLWRCTDPSLCEDTRQRLVDELMAARRKVRAAKASGDPRVLSEVRARVQKVKVALGNAGLLGGAMAVLISIGTRLPILLMRSGTMP